MSIPLATITNISHVDAYTGGTNFTADQTRDAINVVSKEITNNVVRNYKINSKVDEGFNAKLGLGGALVVIGTLIAAGVFSGGIALGVIMAAAGVFCFVKCFLDIKNAASYDLPLNTNQSPLMARLNKLLELQRQLQTGQVPVATSGTAPSANPYL